MPVIFSEAAILPVWCLRINDVLCLFTEAVKLFFCAAPTILVSTFDVNGKTTQYFRNYFVHFYHASSMQIVPGHAFGICVNILLSLMSHDHIKHDCSDDDSTLDDGLQIGADADHVHAVVDKADDEDTKYASGDGCNAACE